MSVASLLVVLTTTILWGGLMAGLRAGAMYPTFPTMNGAWLPAGIGAIEPIGLDLLENPATVHFVHRFLAALTSMLVLLCWRQLKTSRSPLHQTNAFFLLGVVLVLTQYTTLRGPPPLEP